MDETKTCDVPGTDLKPPPEDDEPPRRDEDLSKEGVVVTMIRDTSSFWCDILDSQVSAAISTM